MPAAWYTVHLDSPPQGIVGSTAASITSGNLHVDSAYDPSNTGTGLVYADSASDAIHTALTGGVVVNLSAVSLPPASYTFTEGTSSPSISNHTAFAVTPTAATSTWKVYLEDLTADPTVSDWDYNDFFWTVSAAIDFDPSTIQFLSLSANAPDAVVQSGVPTATAFTVRREGGPLDTAVTIGYEARLAGGGLVASGSATIAAGQTTAAISVTVPPPATGDTSTHTLIVELIDPNLRTIQFAVESRVAATLYPADRVASVGVELSEPYLEVADPDAAFTASGFLVRSGASVSQPLAVRYQLTAEEGTDGTATVDLGTFTAAFATGEDRAAITAMVPPSATPSPDGRSVRVTVLPPLPGTPYPYIHDPDRDVSRWFVQVPKQPPAGVPPANPWKPLNAADWKDLVEVKKLFKGITDVAKAGPTFEAIVMDSLARGQLNQAGFGLYRNRKAAPGGNAAGYNANSPDLAPPADWWRDLPGNTGTPVGGAATTTPDLFGDVNVTFRGATANVTANAKALVAVDAKGTNTKITLSTSDYQLARTASALKNRWRDNLFTATVTPGNGRLPAADYDAFVNAGKKIPGTYLVVALADMPVAADDVLRFAAEHNTIVYGSKMYYRQADPADVKKGFQFKVGAAENWSNSGTVKYGDSVITAAGGTSPETNYAPFVGEGRAVNR